METLAIILAGGRGSRLDILSEKRVKPSVPFAGKYRIIDFALSNLSNSHIYNVDILTQYLPMSLNEHIGVGKPWDMDRRDTNVTLLQPHDKWYDGTADAIRKNISVIYDTPCDYVLILSGDHIYKMNYEKLINFHKEKNALCTVACKVVSIEEASRFGIMEEDENSLITNFIEKPKNPKSNLASMGIYVFNKEVLINELNSYPDINDLDFGMHIIPNLIKTNNLYAYKYYDYWKDVGTYDSYLESNLELIEHGNKVPLDMYDKNWKIYTKSLDLPAAKVGSKAVVNQALLSEGTIISGEVYKSVISPGVIIKQNAKVYNSVILNDTIINEGAIINNSIIDKECIIEKNVQIGVFENMPNIEKPDLLKSGITVLGKGVITKENMMIGKNVRIFPRINFNKTNIIQIKSGETIKE